MQPHLRLSRSRNLLSTIKWLPVDLISQLHLAATRGEMNVLQDDPAMGFRCAPNANNGAQVCSNGAHM